MPTLEALRLAQERGLDLVEVAPMASPPVVRFLDFGQYKYELTKREKEAKRKQRSVTFKEVRLKPKIGVGDFDTKVRRAIEFLEDGDRVKVAVQFRGRELTHPEIGRNLLIRFSEQIKDHGVVERAPLLEGKSMHITVASTHKPKSQEGPTAAAGRTDEAGTEPGAAAAPTEPVQPAQPAPRPPAKPAPAVPSQPAPAAATAAPHRHRPGRQHRHRPQRRAGGNAGSGGGTTAVHGRQRPGRRSPTGSRGGRPNREPADSPARRGVQAAHQPLQLPGPQGEGPAAAGRGPRGRPGLAVVTEVMAPEHVALVANYADVLQVGARNMQNYPLLEAVGESGLPVLLKRGPSATMDEFLLAAEYILKTGNTQVMLCERGIRTFEDHTRFTLPLATRAVPAPEDAPAGRRRSQPRHRQGEPGGDDGPGRRSRRGPTG